MSTFEAKVNATYDFLTNRASLGRVTNHEEIGRVLGVKLMEANQRRIDRPVRREKVIDVLKAVDDRSSSEKGVLLSALVVHFWDNGVGGRFFSGANKRGYAYSNPTKFHADQLAKTIEAYGGAPVTETEVADPFASGNGSVTEKRVREMISEALADSDY